MLPDYHFHTSFSADSYTPVRSQIEKAIRLGMKSLCVTDHHDYDVDSELDFTVDPDRYFREMQAVKDAYREQIDLRIGIELGLQLHLKEYFEELLSAYPFDFVIGSTHFIGRKDVAYPEFFKENPGNQAYLRFLSATLDHVTNLDAYDVAGHLDYIVRYGRDKDWFYRSKDCTGLSDEILKAIIKRGKGIECNTAGLRKGLGQPNPSFDTLKRYRQLGGEIITLGSDAHAPEDLGRDFVVVREFLLSCGFSYYTEFNRRKPEFRPL